MNNSMDRLMGPDPGGLPGTLLPMLGLGWIILAVMMVILWIVGMRIKNMAIVDVGWGFGYAILGTLYAIMSVGSPERRFLLTGMVVFWGLRLGLHLLVDRILRAEEEDGRYQTMRLKWKTGLNVRFFFFFQAQAFFIVLLTIPFALIMANGESSIAPLEWLGAGLWIMASAGEALADEQLRRFKAYPSNGGKVCQTGLWRYSRHPNYFFEWLIWVSYAIMALSSPFGWTGILGPVIMLYLLLKVTGIPLTEEQAIRSRGDLYREYQRTTSAFVPWFRTK